MIARADDLDPERSLTFRGAVVLYPSRGTADWEKRELLPPERQDEYRVVPAKLFVALEDGWRVVPVEMLSAMEDGWRKA